MNNARTRIALLLAMTLAPSICRAWGPEGHRIVGEIASRYLDPKTKDGVHALLGDYSLAEVATWADEIKSDHRYDWAKPLHYVNIPPDATEFKLERDCPPGGCVVSAIAKYAAVLRDDGATAAEKTEALKFLIHFVGDVHNPLHVGYAKDKGGNDVKVEFFFDRTRLHVVWDELLIRHTKKKWSDYANELFARITPAQAAEWSRNRDPSEWATESHKLVVSHVYDFPKDGLLGQEYFDRNIPVVNERLSMAGVRLAAMLNAIFRDARVPTTSTAPATMPTTTTAPAAD